ncbi:MAG: glycosyltransferase family 4 protein [Promethearchaeota archaeon]
MRILQVTPFLNEQYGGSERYCYNLSKELVKLGHEVDVFTSRINKKTPLTSNFDGIKIKRFYTPTVIWNINPLSIMLHRLLKADYDIVHVHSYLYFSSNQAILAKILRSILRRRTPIILHLHGGIGSPSNLLLKPYKRVLKKAYDATIGKLMMLAADGIFASSYADATAAAKAFQHPLEKIRIVYNAIDFTKFSSPINKDDHMSKEILFVGDLERWKGIDTLIQAMHCLSTLGEDFKLKLIGDGSLRQRLESEKNSFNIEFLGQVPHKEIPLAMNSAFTVVLPSYWEGIPTVGLEAMATRTPFIGTNVGGIPEIIQNNITGLLIPPNNPPRLANAILRLRNKKLRQKLTKNAFQLVKNQFEVTHIAKQTIHLYEDTLHH